MHLRPAYWVRQLATGATLVTLALVLAGCVTTERGGVGGKADPQKALDYSLKLARSYIRDGNWESAKRHLKKARDIDDNSAEVYEAMALVFQNTGEVDLARENYEKAIRLDPDASRVRNNYAAFLYSRGEYREAAQQLEVVADDTLYSNRGTALFNLGRCYRQLEEWEKAEQALNRAFLLDRTNPVVMYELANAYYHLGEFPKAQRLYDRYRSKVEQQPPEGLWLGIQLAREFDNRDALSSFALALKNLYPTSREYLLYKREFGNES